MENQSMIGRIGSFLLAMCACPQAIKSYKDKNSNGIDGWFLLLWTLGEIFTFIAVISEPYKLTYLLFNYGLNLVFLSVICYFKLTK